eukprot:scaffold22390_cov28-Tisochrysis_lutea.AAC.10
MPRAVRAARSARVSKPRSVAPGSACNDSEPSHTSVTFGPRPCVADQSRPTALFNVASPMENGTRVSRVNARLSSASKPVSWSAASRSAGCTRVARRLE